MFFPLSKIRLKTRILQCYSGFLVVSGIYILLRFVFLRNTIGHVTYPGDSMAINILTMAKVTASYVKLLFLPIILNADYHVTLETLALSLPFLFSIASLFCIAVITLRLYNKQKGIVFSVLWTCITLLPVMNIIPIGNLMAERYLYIPSLGFCMFLGILMLKIPARIPRSYCAFAKASFTGVLIFYLTHTILHNRIWFDTSTLWSHTVYHTSCSFNAHNNMGKEYFQKGLVDMAIEEYTIALPKASEVQYEYPF